MHCSSTEINNSNSRTGTKVPYAVGYSYSDHRLPFHPHTQTAADPLASPGCSSRVNTHLQLLHLQCAALVAVIPAEQVPIQRRRCLAVHAQGEAAAAASAQGLVCLVACCCCGPTLAACPAVRCITESARCAVAADATCQGARGLDQLVVQGVQLQVCLRQLQQVTAGQRVVQTSITHLCVYAVTRELTTATTA
jgi:hypothetical protein